MRLVSLTLLVFIVTSCSSRTSLISEKQSSQDYWYCQKGTVNLWDCSLEKPAVAVQNQVEEPTQVEKQPQQRLQEIAPAEEVVAVPEASIANEPAQESLVESSPLLVTTPTNETRVELEVEPVVESDEKAVTAAEIRPIVITAQQTGDWLIQLGAFSRENKADKLIGELGLGTKVQADINSKRWYQVVVTGFATKQAALQESQSLKATYPQLQPWVRKFNR